MADSYLALPLQLLGTMIISRLLTPAETGVFAVAAVFAAFASTFRDFGVAEYLIQEKELDSDKIRAALTVNIAVSWLMGLILFFGAPFAAVFYNSQGVGAVMRVQAFNFILIPFGAVTMANFRRLLDFRPIFIANLVANVTTFVVSIGCAYLGMSYMSMAWSSLAGVLVTVIVSVWFRPADFPRWPGVRHIGRVIHFGKFASGIYIFGQLGAGAPEMILGRLQGMVDVALYSRASGLIEIFNRTVMRAVMPVCLPYFAQSNREQGTVVDGYLKSMSYLTAIGWPFLAFVGIEAYAAIRIMYGVQWMDSVPLAQILCVAGAVNMVHRLSKEVLIACGDIKHSNMLQVITQLARIAGLFAVIPFGLPGACWGYLAGSIAGALYAQWLLTRMIGLTSRAVIKTCLPSAGIACFSILPVSVWVAATGISESNFLAHALGGGALTGLCWVLALRFLTHPLWTEVVEVLRKIVTKFRPAL